MESGLLVDLIIYISRSLSPIDCVGKVNRVTAHPDFPIYEIVISFTEIDEQKRGIIKEAVEESLGFKTK